MSRALRRVFVRLLAAALSHVVLALATPVLVATPAAAQQPTTLTTEEVSLANFGYAVQLGSGLYTLDGRTMLILRVPISTDFVVETEDMWGIRGRLQIMGGFFDFQPEDMVESGLPERIDSLAVLPGVEFRRRLARGWLLAPFVEVGVSRNSAGDVDSWIYNAGMRAVKSMRLGAWDGSWGSEVSLVHVSPQGDAESGSALWLESSFEARHLMGFSLGRYAADFSPYLLVDVYWSKFTYPFGREHRDSASEEAEVGITFGTRPVKKILGVELPRFGIGYRVGSNVAVVRIVLGLPARSLDP